MHVIALLFGCLGLVMVMLDQSSAAQLAELLLYWFPKHFVYLV